MANSAFSEVDVALSEATGDYWAGPSIRYLDTPTPDIFLREAVCSYQPVILRGMMDEWPALQKWNMKYFRDALGSKNIRVNITPDGHGDSVRDGLFIYPLEVDMTFDSFNLMMEDRQQKDAVPYLSEQNDNFRSRFPELVDDVPSCLELGKCAFDLDSPEAMNIWIGDERSVSSIHKDHFENFYAVVDGEKTFTLLPPTDCLFMPPEMNYPTRTYALNSCTLGPHPDLSMESRVIQKEDLVLTDVGVPAREVKWIDFDPDQVTDGHQMTRFDKAHPIRCRVQKGEIIYIPAMWYHRVSQTQLTISVNYWYDQRFDFRFVFYQTIKLLSQQRAENSAEGSRHSRSSSVHDCEPEVPTGLSKSES